MILNPFPCPRAWRPCAAATLTVAILLMGLAASPGSAQSSPQAADSLLAQAAELQKAKDYAGAERVYRQALLEAPDDPEILKALGVVYQAEEKYEDSIEIFQRILKRAPLYPGVNGLIGISYYSLKDFYKSIVFMQ